MTKTKNAPSKKATGDRRPLTMFSFGYAGCGRATDALVAAIDGAEAARGFAPAMWIDIRFNRTVSAPGFQGDTFHKLLGERYEWIKALGNENSGSASGGIRIQNPKAASALLDLALDDPKRRIIFFCACKTPAECHRSTVSNLLIHEARRRGISLTVTDWPGGEPTQMQLLVTRAQMAKADADELKRLPIPGGMSYATAASIPWGSIARVSSDEKETFAILGPARFGPLGAYLQVLASGESEQVTAKEMKLLRDTHGFSPLSTRVAHRKKSKTAPSKDAATPHEVLSRGAEYVVLSVRPAWAWAIMFGGKDVENRDWPTNRRGRILIHASGHKSSPRDDGIIRAELCRRIGIAASALPAAFERSAILGSVEIADCVDTARSRWAARGSYHWLLREPRPLATPVREVKGKLQFWRWRLADQGSAPVAPTGSRARAAATLASPTAQQARVPTASGPTQAAPPFDLDNLAPDAVMAALRKVVSSKPANEVDVLRAAGRELGCTRIGPRVRTKLKAEVRTAIRRGVLAREGKELRLATSALADYRIEDLLAAINAVLRKGQAVAKAELAAAVARRLGFPRGESLNALKRAFAAAIAAGSLHADAGDRLRRVA